MDYGTRGVRLQLLGVALVLGKLSGKDGHHKLGNWFYFSAFVTNKLHWKHLLVDSSWIHTHVA